MSNEIVLALLLAVCVLSLVLVGQLRKRSTRARELRLAPYDLPKLGEQRALVERIETRVGELDRKLGDVDEERRALAQAKSELTARLEHAASDLNAARTALRLKSDELVALAREGDDRARAHESALAALRDELRALDERKTAELEERARQLALCETNAAELARRAGDVEADLARTREALAGAEHSRTSEARALAVRETEQQAQLIRAEARANECTAEVERARAELADMRRRAAELLGTHVGDEQRIQELSAQLDANEQLLAATREQLVREQAEATHTARRLAELEPRAAELSAAQEQRTQRIATLEARLTRLSNAAKTRVERLENDARSSRAQLEHSASNVRALREELERSLILANDANARMAEARALGESQRERASELERRLAAAQAVGADSGARLAELERQLADEHAAWSTCRAELEQSQTELARANERAAELSSKLEAHGAEFRAHIVTRDEDLARVRGELEAARAELGAATREHASLTGELATLRSAHAELDQARAALEATVALANAELDQTRSAARDADARSADLARRLAEQACALTERDERVRGLETGHAQQVRELRGHIDGCDAELARRAEALRSLQDELTRAREHASACEGESQRLAEELSASGVHANGIEEQRRELERAVAEQARTADEWRALAEQRAGEVEALRGDQQRSSTRLAHLEHETTQLAAQVTERAQAGQAAEQRIQELERTLATRVRELQGHIDGCDAELARRAERLERLQSELLATRASTAESARASQSLEATLRAQLDEARATGRDLAERSIALERALEQREHEFLRLSAEHRELNDRDAELRRALESRAQELIEHEEQVHDIRAQVESLSSALDAQRRTSEAEGASLDALVDARLDELFGRRADGSAAELPRGYLDALAECDLELAVRTILGRDEPLAEPQMQRLVERWTRAYERWKATPIEQPAVYLWADGCAVRTGLGGADDSLLLLIGGMLDGSKSLLAVDVGPRSSGAAWQRVLQGAVARGLAAPRLLVADAALGVWSASAGLGWNGRGQFDWTSSTERLVSAVPKRGQRRALTRLRAMLAADTRATASELKDAFREAYGQRAPEAAEGLQREWPRLSSYFAFPREHWAHLRTTSVVESPLAALRVLTSQAKALPACPNAHVILWRLLRSAEGSFRKLNAAQLMAPVADGQAYSDGLERSRARQRAS